MSRLPKRGEIGTPATKFAVSGEFEEKPKKGKPEVSPSELEKADPFAVDAAETSREKQRHEHRMATVGHPGPLQGADAEAFVERKQVEMSVDAVCELEWFLKYGTSAERERALARVLDSTGHGKKDRLAGGANLIIVNMNGGGGTPVPLPPMLMPPMLTGGKT